MESYIAEECATFCSRYLHDIETKQSHEEQNYVISGNITIGGLTIFKCIGCTIGKSAPQVLTQRTGPKHICIF